MDVKGAGLLIGPPGTIAAIRRRPLVGVGAILFDGDRILMAQRGKQPLQGWWSLPGGALETGESLAGCGPARGARGDRP